MQLTGSCIDCLDRTNVVQSAIARRVLTLMLTQLGIVLDPKVVNIEPLFNDSECGGCGGADGQSGQTTAT